MTSNENGSRKRIGVVLALCVSLVLGVMMGGFGGSAEAALCPAASDLTMCMDFTEGTGAVIQSTVVTPIRDGAALQPITVPASSPTGGQTRFASVPTVACQNDTYTATAFTNYTIGGVPFTSLIVNATPGGGTIKNRAAEVACTIAPTNFTMH